MVWKTSLGAGTGRRNKFIFIFLSSTQELTYSEQRGESRAHNNPVTPSLLSLIRPARDPKHSVVE